MSRRRKSGSSPGRFMIGALMLFFAAAFARPAALQEQKGITVDKKKISLAEPIKATGEYQAKISLYENTSATIKVIVKS